MKQKVLFRALLMKWHGEENKRAMPWKGEKDAYKVWLSEIILQQTRVEQGRSYYEKFVQYYATITQLANAKDEEVFKLWEGLGYYTRCKNLLHTARFIRDNYNSIFPSNYNGILNLKGVGAYTASAIASFCYNLPHAVVDGNVLRILSRYFGIDKAIDSTAGKKYFAQLAQECLDKENPAEYNQSIMDFGATICKPLPLCNKCPLQKKCIAYNTNAVGKFPVKEKQLKKRERWFNYFVLSFNNKIYIQQRNAKDIWQSLHEFYLEETTINPEWNENKVKRWLHKNLNIPLTNNIQIIAAKKQLLTHQVINGYFIFVELKSKPMLKSADGKWLSNNDINKLAFPQFMHQFIGRKTVQMLLL